MSGTNLRTSGPNPSTRSPPPPPSLVVKDEGQPRRPPGPSLGEKSNFVQKNDFWANFGSQNPGSQTTPPPTYLSGVWPSNGAWSGVLAVLCPRCAALRVGLSLSGSSTLLVSCLRSHSFGVVAGCGMSPPVADGHMYMTTVLALVAVHDRPAGGLQGWVGPWMRDQCTPCSEHDMWTLL